MKLYSKLYTKLTLVMLGLFVTFGIAVVYICTQTSEMVYMELTQRINRDIALHAAQDMSLFNQNQANQEALRQLAVHVMYINPMVEVYLLGMDGKILAHAMPGDTQLKKK